MAKQKYTVVIPVERASGTQTYVVEATSAEEARRLVGTGDIECECEELTVEKVADAEEWEVFNENNDRVE